MQLQHILLSRLSNHYMMTNESELAARVDCNESVTLECASEGEALV
jgi:hypothetical protein